MKNIHTLKQLLIGIKYWSFRSFFLIFALISLGTSQMWGATQRYIYCGISDNFDTYKDNSNWGFNFWGGTSAGVKTPTYIENITHDGRTYHMYRVQVYDDNNKAQFKGNNDWWVPSSGFSVTLTGTTNNAVFFSASADGWDGQFQENYQVTSTASLSASSTSITTAQTSTLTPSLSSNSTYNTIKSTSYSVTTNPGSGGSVTSAGVFSATKAGTYTVTATVTYNAKDFSDITKTATATKNITVTAVTSINLSAPESGIRGESVTLTATPTNATTPTITYKYSTSSTFASSVTQIASTTNTSQSWTIPAGSEGTTYYLRAEMTISGTTYYSSILTLTAYGKKTIHVKNTNNWGTFKIHHWGASDANATDWPGTTTGISAYGSGQWKNVVILSCYDGFILNNGESTNGHQSNNLSYEDYTDGSCYEFATASTYSDGANKHALSAGTCPSAPTSVTTTATPISVTNTKMTIGGNIGGNGNDNITDYGFYWGTTSACGTKAQVGTSNTTGAISKQLTGLTAGTTYYFKTYATNGQGTTYGTVRSYKIPYSVTITKSTGCESITPSAGSYYYNTGFTVTAVAATGYNFSAWTTTNGTTSSASSPSTGTNTVTFTPTANSATITATYTPKTTSITLNQTGCASAGSVTSRTGTYNAAMPAITGSGSLPTAPTGYAFMGYWDGENGTGTQYYTATGTSAHNWDKTVSSATLYAYFKKAEITAITITPAIVATGGTATASPVISPTPEGTTEICWKLLYNNGNLIESQPTFSRVGSTNNVTFTVPTASGTYLVAAILHTGTGCGSGTVLDSITQSFQVAGDHEVTIDYKCDGRTIRESIEVTGKPLVWSDDITAPTITGYTFVRWEAGDGISIKNGESDPVTTTTDATIKIKAIYDGTLTAIYSQKRMVYFCNTLNWENVYVYFYKNDSYWDNSGNNWGTGADQTYTYTNTPYSEGLHGQMSPISEGSNIYYFDAEAAGVNASYDDIVFTALDQHGYGYFAYQFETTNRNKVVRRGDYKSTSLPMYVPVSQDPVLLNNGQAEYYNEGYWMNYPANTGYSLWIYNYYTDGEPVRKIPFPFSADTKMPLKLDVEFNNADQQQYWFAIHRNDGSNFGVSATMTQDSHNEYRIYSGVNKVELLTTVSGIYTFTLSYYDDGTDGNQYHINVDYPIALNDYRLKYQDNATWSLGTAHTGTWYHPSAIIPKNTNNAITKYDTVSLFISKGSSPTIKFQKVSAIDVDVSSNPHKTTVTWTDSASITIPNDVVTEAGVYNFIIKQVGKAKPVVEKVVPYDGNYYIRTDCAGSTKWDSYRNSIDHLMTYSDYAAEKEDFTHYYAHWVNQGTNVKFVIANDYSPCISDTLIKDVDITFDNMTNDGFLKTQDGVADHLSKYSANIRFMWDEATNKISRAYIAGSSNTSHFLIMQGASSAPKIYDAAGNDLAIDGLSANAINLVDDQNFIYETTIKANPTARIKLKADYCDVTQYFKGDDNASFAGEHGMEILGGTASASKESMRIVYDFKTNRLVCAWLPSGTITGDVDINADVMIIREHQGDASQITFSNNSSKLSEVKTVYGVMRFNRWILNNRANPTDMAIEHSLNTDSITKFHPVLTSGQKSADERGLYWISFPFDVNLSDVFGLGTYGTHWIILKYNSAERARIGWWLDTGTFWEYIWDRRGVTLEAGMGYVLALDLDLMKHDNSDFWTNNIQQVELFFPSASNINNIKEKDVEIELPEYTCTICRQCPEHQNDLNYDRRVADSHWNLIGVPSYANYNSTLSDGSSTITWHTNPRTQDIPFLYEWNATDNTYTIQSSTKYPFKAMHAYFVQYHGILHWSLASAASSNIVARRTYETPQNIEMRLELQQDAQFADQTFIKLTDDEEASANFVFGEDMCKEANAGKANIYTIVENYLPTAGNTMPMSEQMTIVPVGVTISTTGDYTFAMPDGTEGIGVTLVDNETGIRTSLSALNYTINLEPGDYKERFALEISPIKNTPTGVETISDEGLEVSGARKVMIDGILYIVKDGRMYDARGARVE